MKDALVQVLIDYALAFGFVATAAAAILPVTIPRY
jgi:hypothetical protein